MNARNSSLDVLRGVAVLMVICCHYPLWPVLSTLWLGVDLFFVLSGFLISGLLFSDIEQFGTIRLRRFFIRRAAKIYPSFYVFLIVTWILWKEPWHWFIIHLAFLQNYRVIHIWIWAHTWSLAVEEHFYILLPLVLLCLARYDKLRWLPRTAVVLAGLCWLVRICEGSHDVMMFNTQSRIDALFAGVALGYFYHFHREKFTVLSRWWMLPVGLLLVLPTILTVIPNPVILSTALLFNLVGFSMILCCAVTRQMHIAPLQFIGKHSYSIYLWHTVVLIYFLRKPMTPAHFIENILLALALGIVMARLIEFPALRLRNNVEAHFTLESLFRQPIRSLLVRHSINGDFSTDVDV